MSLSAKDKDSGDSGHVTYSILQTEDSNSAKLFEVNSDTGELSLKASLDREQSSQHVVYIMAKDNGSPPLSGKWFVLVDFLPYIHQTMSLLGAFSLSKGYMLEFYFFTRVEQKKAPLAKIKPKKV